MRYTTAQIADGVWTHATRTVDAGSPQPSNGTFLDDISYAVWTYGTRTVESGGVTGTIAATATSGTASATGTRTIPARSGTVSAVATAGVASATGTRTVPAFSGTVASVGAAGTCSASGTFVPAGVSVTGTITATATEGDLIAVGNYEMILRWSGKMGARQNFTREIVRFQGRNTALAVTLENVNELSNAYLYSSSAFGNSAYTLDIISSSTADAAAGTGARKVLIAGLDANWELVFKEYTLNGQTAVTTTGDTWLRVFEANVTTTGTGLVNAGDIYIYKTGSGGTITAGVPGALTSAWIKVLAGYGAGHSGMFTVPAGKAYRMEYFTIGSRTQPGEIQLYSQNSTNTLANSLMLEDHYAIGVSGVAQFPAEDETPLRWGEKVDIFPRALSSTAAGAVTFMCALREIRPQMV